MTTIRLPTNGYLPRQQRIFLLELSSLLAEARIQDVCRLAEENDAYIGDLSSGRLSWRDIRDAIVTNSWDNMSESFSLMNDCDSNLFVGPLSSMELAPPSLEVLASRRSDIGSWAVKLVEKHQEDVVSLLFGYKGTFQGRQVEMHNLEFASGPFRQSGLRHIALFTPFYLAELSSKVRDKLMAKRRSLIFLNIILERFRRITLPTAAMGGRFPFDLSLLDASEEELEKWIAIWVSLHELIHAHGPIPLFGSHVQKLQMGSDYAFLEEARVDMSVWLVLGRLQMLSPEFAPEIRDLILLDRIVRSSSHTLNQNSDDCLDAEHGQTWLNVLMSGGGIEVSRGTLVVHPDLCEAAITAFLSELFEVESNASENNGNEGARVLVDYARSFRKRFRIGEYPCENVARYYRERHLPKYYSVQYDLQRDERDGLA